MRDDGLSDLKELGASDVLGVGDGYGQSHRLARWRLVRMWAWFGWQ